MYIGQLRAYILPSIILPSDMNVLQKISVQKNKGLRTLKEFSFGWSLGLVQAGNED